MKIPLIADFSKRMSKSYGVLVEDENDENCDDDYGDEDDMAK